MDLSVIAADIDSAWDDIALMPCQYVHYEGTAQWCAIDINVIWHDSMGRQPFADLSTLAEVIRVMVRMSDMTDGTDPFTPAVYIEGSGGDEIVLNADADNEVRWSVLSCYPDYRRSLYRMEIARDVRTHVRSVI